MKNFVLKNAVAFGVFLCFFFVLNSDFYAQNIASCSSYTIINSSPCPIEVQYEYLCNGATCLTTMNANIGVGGTFNIVPPVPCTGCSGGNCDVKVKLVKMNGNFVTGSQLTVQGSGSHTGSYNVPPACSTASGTITWTPNSTTIN